MLRFDENTSVCHVYVYNEGLLTAFGHDLCVEVLSFVIEIAEDASSIAAVFDARSLHVGCAIVNGIERKTLLKPEDKKNIDHNIFWDILEAGKHPMISVKSTGVVREENAFRITALLTLHGTTQEISFRVVNDGDRLTADIRLHMPDFGIAPFSAFFGALRIKADILIRLLIPAAPFSRLFSAAPSGAE